MRDCHVLRVFTRGDVGGNHLGVVTDPAGLSAAAMQEIAARLGFSETVFVEPGPVPHVRIFTPGAEIPFAGHPLVGVAWLLGNLNPGVSRVTCGIGEIRVRPGSDGASVDAPMTTDVREAPEGVEVAALGRLPEPTGAWWADMPIPYLVLEVGSAAEVAAAAPDFPALATGPSGEATYLFARSGDRVRARFFATDLGVDEDPATGSAAAALAAVLSHLGERSGALWIDQGDEIGHPSTIGLSWDDGVVTLTGTVRRDEVRVLDS
jgi:trans-2,3-dihydro-3-hydroxyanthranilate isomerase